MTKKRKRRERKPERERYLDRTPRSGSEYEKSKKMEERWDLGKRRRKREREITVDWWYCLSMRSNRWKSLEAESTVGMCREGGEGAIHWWDRNGSPRSKPNSPVLVSICAPRPIKKTKKDASSNSIQFYYPGRRRSACAWQCVRIVSWRLDSAV